MADYRVEVYDTWGRRIASYDEVPLLEATRSMPDEADTVRGILPGGIADLSHGYRIRVYVAGVWFCDALVTEVAPQWSDTRKLILDRYVSFHEVAEFKAERAARDGNTRVRRAYTNRCIGYIVKDAINAALGPVHYLVAHEAYPDGAEREYAKFLARKTAGNELEAGGISSGQWAGSGRIDASGAYAKDGDTIAGLVVDGVAWPDVRLMMIDCEETSRNSHAIKRHPEVAEWTDDEYAVSGYKFCADAAATALQAMVEAGIDFIELNPHVDDEGNYDDRVDAYGRYIGIVYGGGECFNAAQVELGHADVYLYEDGAYHVPEMALKEYYSYTGAAEDSIEESDVVLCSFGGDGGVFELLTALAYAADGFVWSANPDLAVRFRKAERADRVVFFDPLKTGVALGSDCKTIGNILYFSGHPVLGPLKKTYARSASIDEYGAFAFRLKYFPISVEEDADKLAAGLLDDLAYPEPRGFVQFYQGDAVRIGDIMELRDGPLRRLERCVDGEWGDRFSGKLVGRVRRVRHRFSGRQVTTTAWLTSPLRSVGAPASFVARSQDSAEDLYQFRLDAADIGLDMGYHLD